MSDTENLKHRFQKKKKRRKREKYINRDSIQSKEKECGSNIQRHVQKAEEIVSHSKADARLPSNTVCAISSNRITNRLGLFNKSKKSSRIIREPIAVPETVQKRTDADLKRILSDVNTLAEESPTESLYINDPASPQVNDSLHDGRTVLQDPTEPAKKHCRKTRETFPKKLTVFRTSTPVLSEEDSDSDTVSQVSTDSDGFNADTPNRNSLVKEMLLSLKARNVFKDCNYYERTKKELSKVLRQTLSFTSTPSSIRSVHSAVTSSSATAMTSSTITRLSPTGGATCQDNQSAAMYATRADNFTSHHEPHRYVYRSPQYDIHCRPSNAKRKRQQSPVSKEENYARLPIETRVVTEELYSSRIDTRADQMCFNPLQMIKMMSTGRPDKCKESDLKHTQTCDIQTSSFHKDIDLLPTHKDSITYQPERRPNLSYDECQGYRDHSYARNSPQNLDILDLLDMAEASRQVTKPDTPGSEYETWLPLVESPPKIPDSPLPPMKLHPRRMF